MRLAIGGLRTPGAREGVYSLRSSFSNDSLGGVRVSSSYVSELGCLFTRLTIFRRFDSIDLAARSLEDLLKTTTAVLDVPASPELPKKIVYLNDLVRDLPKEQLSLLDGFVKDLEDFLGVKAQRLSLGDIWDDKPPSNADGQALQSFMKEVMPLLEISWLC